MIFLNQYYRIVSITLFLLAQIISSYMNNSYLMLWWIGGLFIILWVIYVYNYSFKNLIVEVKNTTWGNVFWSILLLFIFFKPSSCTDYDIDIWECLEYNSLFSGESLYIYWWLFIVFLLLSYFKSQAKK